MRLIVARCEARYTGRLDTFLPEALRLVMIKSDGSVMIHADTGGYKPQNWMTPPTTIEEIEATGDEPRMIVVTKRAGATEDRVEIRIAEVVSDVTHDMGEAAALEHRVRHEGAARPEPVLEDAAAEVECGAAVGRVVHRIGERDEHVVVQVVAHRQLGDDLDAVATQVLGGTDTGEHQDLRGAVGTG